MKNITLIAMLLFISIANLDAQQKNLTLYGNMSLADAKAIKASHPNEIDIIAVNNNEAAVHMSEEVDHLLHELRSTHGPGYTYSSSAEVAIQDINTSRMIRPSLMNFTITEGESVEKALQVISKSNIEDQIKELEGYGSRFHTKSGANKSGNDLKAKWEAMAALYNRDDVSVRIVQHRSTPMNSVVMTIKGAELPKEHVIIGGHLDSTSNNNNTAPGGDDDASGISVITEATRTLFEIGFVPKRTIEVMAYAGEERGLLGSREIADDYGRRNVNVVAVGQFDMSNFKSSSRDVYFVSDSNAIDPSLTGFFQKLLDTYHGSNSGDRITYGTTLCGYGCSDHRFWFENGYKTAFPFESSFSDFQRNNFIYHRTNDLMRNVPGGDASHSFKFAKLAVEYLIEVAKKSKTLSSPEFSQEGYELYVINDHLKFKSQPSSSAIKSLVIFDVTGKRVLKNKNLGNKGSVSLNGFSAGAYVVSLELENKKEISKKVILN